MTIERMLDRIAALAVVALNRAMQRAAVTRYRKDATDDIEKLLEDLDRARGVLPPMDRRTRALLLAVKRPADASADAAAVVAYVRAVALGAGWTELAAQVQATGDPELMRRFLRYSPSSHRTEVRKTCSIAEVLCS